jgi:L-asparaginase/Glu-tRNA(Gln) amidotransferase subunit D
LAGVNRPDIDGVIVTQGTDTLEETAFLLQLTLKTSKPVIVTGAMRPFEYGSPDGPDNLRCAAKFILDASDRNLGVLVAFQFQIFSAFNVAKILSYPPTVRAESEKLPCPFHSPSFGPISRLKPSFPWNRFFPIT